MKYKYLACLFVILLISACDFANQDSEDIFFTVPGGEGTNGHTGSDWEDYCVVKADGNEPYDDTHDGSMVEMFTFGGVVGISSAFHTFHKADDVDWFKVEFNYNGGLWIYMDNVESADNDDFMSVDHIELYSSDLTPLCGPDADINYSPCTNNGVYYIKASAFGKIGGYNLQIYANP